jgi:protein-disulfide isomerase
VFRGYAEDLGLEMDQYRECVSSRRYEGRFAAFTSDAAAAGIGSTPTFIIDGRLYPGALSFDQMNELITGILERQGN